MESVKAELVRICSEHILPPEANVVLHEPYIPFLPDNWHGHLMLAEAQNLSASSQGYIDELKGKSAEDRINRLYSVPGSLGIGPWDDNTMKLAYEAAFFGQSAENVAVSNGVLWSERTDSGLNKNPSDELIELSSKIWTALLLVLKPKIIITCGRIASIVIRKIENPVISDRHIALCSPSRTFLSRISGLFPEPDLLKRYTEVANLQSSRGEWFRNVTWGNHRQNKIFFACHAVSICSGSVKGVEGA